MTAPAQGRESWTTGKGEEASRGLGPTEAQSGFDVCRDEESRRGRRRQGKATGGVAGVGQQLPAYGENKSLVCPVTHSSSRGPSGHCFLFSRGRSALAVALLSPEHRAEAGCWLHTPWARFFLCLHQFPARLHRGPP